MKTFISFKNLLATLAFALTFAASANIRENNLELTQVRSLDASNTELTFSRSFINEDGQSVKQSIKATDDDGMLTVAAINFALSQGVSEAILQKAKEDGLDAAKADWEGNKHKSLSLKQGENKIAFPTIKPALLNALNRLAIYSSKSIAELKAAKNLAERKGDFYSAQILANDLAIAEAENKAVLKAHKDILALTTTISPKQLSDIIGNLLNLHGSNHKYTTSIDGEPALILPLLDNDASNLVTNPLGTLFASRPLQMNDEIFRMGDARGNLILAPNVLQEMETAHTVSPAAEHTTTRRASSLSEILE